MVRGGHEKQFFISNLFKLYRENYYNESLFLFKIANLKNELFEIFLTIFLLIHIDGFIRSYGIAINAQKHLAVKALEYLFRTV